MCTVFAAISLRSKVSPSFYPSARFIRRLDSDHALQVQTVFELTVWGNKELLVCCFLVIATLMAIINFKPLNHVFDVIKLPYVEIVYIFLYTSLVLVVMDTVKAVVRLFNYSRSLCAKPNKTVLI